MSTSALPLTQNDVPAADSDRSRSTIRLGTRLIFEGKPGTFLSLLVKGALLQIPTFGFYRFWLITRLRRHLWANTRIGADVFEYTGTGRELLIGFLIAMAVVVPIYVGYAILGFIAEEMQAFASVPLLLVLYLLGQFGAYRARRYRASRTIFRGLRFWMTGSGWGYAFRAAGWGLLSLVTLGLTFPWASASLERYKMRRTRYGSLEGDFVATGWQLAKRAWYLWVLAVPVPIAILVGVVLKIADSIRGPVGAGDIAQATGLGVMVAMLLALLIVPFLLAAHAGWHANGIRFGSVAVHSDLGTRAFFGTFVKLVGSTIGLLVAFAILAALFAFAFQDAFSAIAHGEVTVASASVVVSAVLGYLALLLGFGVISRYFIARGLWAVLAASITVSNVSAIDAAVAAGDAASAFGEGLADALDFGGGL
jgi:uncharacterized membrane protein YjgN (DUF898 family)